MKKRLITLVILMVTNQLFSQNYKFEKVSKEELQEQFYQQDSSANAVVLYKNRRTFFKYIQGEGFMVETIVHERIKIYNKEGYDWATKYVSYYNPKSSDSEKVRVLEAKTYSLKAGKIQTNKLNKKEIFDEKVSRYWSRKKFTMPNISEGCVVEWKYKLVSPYRSIDKVELQYRIPIKKIECSIEIPEYYQFNIKHTGYIQINSEQSVKNSSIALTFKSRSDGFNSPSKTSFSSQKIDFSTRITKIDNTNIPALIEETYVNEMDNYRTAIYYELSSINWPNEPIKYFSKSWEDVTKTIRKKHVFGDELNKTTYFKDDLAKIIVESGGNKNQILANIFEFVKQKVKWNGVYQKYSYNGVRKAYKDGSGSAADINFILISMLREASINANPVLISTRDHGVPVFPTIKGFNYVIVAVEIENNMFLLDATEEYSIPNVMPLRDLNGRGRLVRKDGASNWVNLTPTQLSETNSIMNIVMTDDGLIEGVKSTKYTKSSALNYRNKYLKIRQDDIISAIEIKKGNIKISDFRITNKDEIYKPIIEIYKFSSEELVDIVGDKIYFKSLFFDAITKNPFELEKRVYPIDFGTPFLNKNMVSMTIPEGYVVESIPENFAIGLPNNYGTYRFNISVSGNKISIYAIFKMNTAIYPVKFYSGIKEFYKQIVTKNLERIVLKEID